MANNTRSIYTDYVLYPCLILFVISFSLPIAYNSTLAILFSIVFLAGVKNLKNNIRSYFSLANKLAQASPMPDVAPVINAIFAIKGPFFIPSELSFSVPS